MLLHDVSAWGNGGMEAWTDVDMGKMTRSSSILFEALPLAHLALCRGAIPTMCSESVMAAEHGLQRSEVGR